MDGGPAKRSTAHSAVLVDGVSKHYGRRTVLKNVSFSLGTGTLVEIEGENGSGKSTLMRCLAGLTKRDSGPVHVSGRPGFCPQEPLLVRALTVREQLNLCAAGYGLPPEIASFAAAHWADRFDCTAFLDVRCDRSTRCRASGSRALATARSLFWSTRLAGMGSTPSRRTPTSSA
jgi:ABC-type multidrug transport system ATPase subunit